MKKVFYSLIVAFLFIGCGNSQDAPKTEQTTSQQPKVSTKPDTNTLSQDKQTTPVTTSENTNPAINNQNNTQTTPQVTPQNAQETILGLKHDAENIIPIDEASPKIPDTPQTQNITSPKTVTVYVHGYDDKGVTYQSVYGYDAYDPMLDNFVKLTGFDTLKTYNPKNFSNIIAITPYYGTQAPDYYTPEDIQDIKDITSQYGGGIPRYALIVAKYAKHVMALTGADHVNFIGASLGALVSRWIIEKDVEHLASEKKILRWMSIEGVIRGNKMASKSNLVSFINTIQEQPIDVKQMDYAWIEKNLHSPRYSADSPYYGNILISQLTSTKAADPFGWLMPATPNDGYQAVEDTYFKSFSPSALFHNQQPSHTYFHQTHLGIKKDLGAWANIATFFLPHKRIKITLIDATVDDIHEHTNYFNKRAEIVFSSEIFSPLVKEKWGIEDAISEQTYESGRLPIRRYKRNHEKQLMNQIIYDDYILENEQTLTINLAGYEIDNSVKYHVHDGIGKKSYLGNTQIDIPIKDGTYAIQAKDWSGHIKVEMLPTYL